MGRRVALVIANHHYRDPDLRQLTAPANDAEALAAVLGDPEIAGFEVTTLVNEPQHRVGTAIGDFYRDRRHDDLALLYFSGHGLKDDAGRLYLAMTDTRRDSLLFTALSAQQLDQAMEGCVSRRLVLILDCCYSGAFPAGRLAKGDPQVHALERFGGRGRTVLTASDATQYSFEGDQLTGSAVESVFTRHLVAGLRDGTADLDGDGDITLDELYSYVHDRVTAELPQQRPKKQDDVEGRIVIARNVHWTLPAYVRNALASPIAADRLSALDALEHLHRIGNGMVRERVAAETRRLVGDDSRAVSAAAEARLRELSPAPTGDGVRSVPVAPEPVRPGRVEPEAVRPVPVAPEAVRPGQVESESVRPVAARPESEAPEARRPIAEDRRSEPEPPTEPGTPQEPARESIAVRATREAIRRGAEATAMRREPRVSPKTPPITTGHPPPPRADVDPSPPILAEHPAGTISRSPRSGARWLAAALTSQLAVFVAATIANTASKDSTVDGAYAAYAAFWGLALLFLAKALAGFAPTPEVGTRADRARYTAGVTGCAIAGCGLVLGMFGSTFAAGGLNSLMLLVFGMATLGVATVAVQGRRCGVWSIRAAATLCALVVAWWAERFAHGMLFGIPELVLLAMFIAYTGDTDQRRPNAARSVPGR